MTDIPSMKIIKERGGNAIAVYRPKSKHKNNALKLLMDNRVNFALPADYREHSELDHVVKTILDKLAKERDLEILKVKEDKKKRQIQKGFSSNFGNKIKSLAKKLTSHRKK